MAREAGDDWIRRANDRPLGRVEFREVTIEIGSGRRARSLSIHTLREQQGRTARALFCVMKPLPFANVNYVAAETRGCPGFDSVHLYLPYLMGTLREVPPEKHCEGFLGCDFSYLDLRVWLPEEQWRYELGESEDGVVHLRGQGDAFRGPVDVMLDAVDGFIFGILYRDTAGAVVREYRAGGKQRIGGVAIPSVMTMTDHRRRHATTIRLQRAWYDRPVEPGVFDPAFRKRTRDYLATL